MNSYLAWLTNGKRLPVIVAAEAAECGLACLAMIGDYHGHEVDLNGLRQRFPISIGGVTLKSLMDIARSLSLAPRALRVGRDAIGKLALPAILHWDLNHFVVLKSVGKTGVVIHDPALGARSLELSEFSQHYTGVAVELTPGQNFNPIVAKRPVQLSGLWSKLTGLWPSIFQILALSAAYQVATFALPFHMQLVVDEAIGRGDYDLLTILALGFGALTLLHCGLEALRSWILRVTGSMMLYQVAGNIVRHLIRLPLSYFEKRHVGDIMSRIESTSSVQDAITRGMAAALVDGVMSIILAWILFVYSPLLAGIVIGSLALTVCVSLLFYPMMRAQVERRALASAREQSYLMETMRASATIKLMGAESLRESGWLNRYAAVTNAAIGAAKTEVMLKFVQTAIIGLQTVLIIYMGARQVLEGDGFSVGMLVAFMSFRQTFSDRTMSLITEAIQFRLLGFHLGRIADIVTSEVDPSVGVEPALQHAVKGGLEMSDIRFSYGVGDAVVLDDLNLKIEPGEFVAITGPSGSGKSTLFKLMSGLHSPTGGQVMLDGRAATPDMWKSWRGQMGIVAQDGQLISGSIADNIAFFDHDLDMAAICEAAMAAGIHDEIMHMPMQYLSLVGEMGAALSGGQKQRILLARALYRRPKVLLLDEGTANLDEASEMRIADLVESLDITRVVIAHRPALIRKAQRVIRIEGGKARDVECA